MEVYELESAKDYRLEKLQGSDLYLTPAETSECERLTQHV